MRLTFNSGVVVPLPVGTADPGQRLRAISAGTRLRKQHPDEGIAGIVAMPASLARLGVAWARHAAATHINLYVTNVPGPPGSLHLARACLLEAIPVAPLVADIRLSVTALSYAGVLSIALLADESVTNLPAMAAGMQSVLGLPDHTERSPVSQPYAWPSPAGQRSSPDRTRAVG